MYARVKAGFARSTVLCDAVDRGFSEDASQPRKYWDALRSILPTHKSPSRDEARDPSHDPSGMGTIEVASHKLTTCTRNRVVRVFFQTSPFMATIAVFRVAPDETIQQLPGAPPAQEEALEWQLGVLEGLENPNVPIKETQPWLSPTIPPDPSPRGNRSD